MQADAVAWLVAAIILLIGALLGVLTRRDRLWLPLTALAAGLLGVLIGVGSHAWWPAEPIAEALALLAGGALQLPVADRCTIGRRGVEPGVARHNPGTPARRSVAAGGLAAWRDLPARHVDLASAPRGCVAGNCTCWLSLCRGSAHCAQRRDIVVTIDDGRRLITHRQ
jgi:hypothetical protein